METTTELLDQVKARYGLASDYALAPKLGVTRAMISKYRHGIDGISAEKALRIAELLELDPGYVLACSQAERAKTEEAKKAWEQTAERLAALARREAAGDCILCKIGRPSRSGRSGHTLHLPTMHPGVIMAAQRRFNAPGHAHP